MHQLISLILVVALAAGFYVGWNIGSNDAANAMGTAVGARVLTYRRAVSILIIFVILGAVLGGWKVMGTVGEDIVVPPAGEDNPFAKIPIIAVVALIAAGMWVTIASTFGFPVSTSQSMVGAVMGAGLLISFLGPINGITASVKFDKLGVIGLCWVLSPVGGAIAAFILYKLLNPALRWVKDPAKLNRIFGFLVIVAGAFAAYTLGTNDVGASTGVLYAVLGGDVMWSAQFIALFGGVALAVGAITYSRRVMQTVGSGITQLDVTTACVAQLGAAITVWTFNQFGIPVSTSQAIVGAIVGVGLVKGTTTVSKRKLGQISIAWILTPTVAAAMSFFLGWLAIGVL